MLLDPAAVDTLVGAALGANLDRRLLLAFIPDGFAARLPIKPSPYAHVEARLAAAPPRVT